MGFFRDNNIKTICLFVCAICLGLFFINCSEDGIESRSYNSEGNNTNDSGSDSDSANSVCPSDKKAPHYQVVNGQCLPSCGVAAGLAGYGGSGVDGQRRTSDDPHIYSTSAASCGELESLNQDDWEDFTFQYSSTSAFQSNEQVQEVARSGGVCCVRGESQNIDDSEEEDNFLERVEDIPNMKHIIDQIAEQCPVIMQAVWSDSQQSWSGDLRFLDLTVEALRKEDRRWGYTFWTRTGYEDSWSADRVGYFHGTGDPYDSTDIGVIDYLAPKKEGGKWVYYVDWLDGTEGLKRDYPDATGYWKFPRPGASVSLSDCSNTTTTTTLDPSQFGLCEAPDHSSVAKQVAKDYPDLLAISNNKDAKDWRFLEKLVEELRKVDTKWGFYHRTEHNLQEASLDAIAYYCGEGEGNGSSDLRFYDVISSKLKIGWLKDEDRSRSHPDKGYWKYPRQ